MDHIAQLHRVSEWDMAEVFPNSRSVTPCTLKAFTSLFEVDLFFTIHLQEVAWGWLTQDAKNI